MNPESVLAQLAVIVSLGMASQWTAWRLRVPSILLLLLTGLLVGPLARLGLGAPILDPERLFGPLLLPGVSLAVGLVLYEGGFSLRRDELQHVGPAVRNLISIGCLVTWGLAALAAWLLGVEARVAAVLGAVLTVTGPTVVGPLLRHVRPKGNAGAVLKWEGILIDPVGATLAVLVLEAVLSRLDAGQGVLSGAGSFLVTCLVGSGFGVAGAAGLVMAIRRHWVPDTLENALSLAMVVACFVGANRLHHEAGLLAATVMGVVVSNALREQAKHLLEFNENLRVLIVGVLFMVLAARIHPSELAEALGWRPLLFVLLLILVVRPASVLVSAWGTSLSRAERVFLAWMAPRGIVAAAVSAVFALRMVEEGLPEGRVIAPMTFLVIVVTVAVYGLTAGPLARRLGLAESDPQGVLLVGAHAWARELARALKEGGASVTLMDVNQAHVTDAKLAGLEAVHANALSEALESEIETRGVGHVLALTPNDEVNALVATRGAETLGRARTYRIAPRSGAPAHLSPLLPGRSRALFSHQATFETLDERQTRGDAFRVTKLTPEFTFRRWREVHGPDALPLLLLTGRGGLVLPFTPETRIEPSAGDTVIGLVPKFAPLVLDPPGALPQLEAVKLAVAALANRAGIPTQSLIVPAERQITALAPWLAVCRVSCSTPRTFEVGLVRTRTPEHPDQPRALVVVVSSPDMRRPHLEVLAVIAQRAEDPGTEQQWAAAESLDQLRAVLLGTTAVSATT